MATNPENLKLKKLSTNVINTLLRQSFSIIFGLSISILLARILGPTGNGQYTMCLLLPAMLATFLNFGIDSANVYFVASNKTSLISALKSSILLWFLLSIVGIIISIYVIIFQSEALFPGIPVPFLWIGMIVFPILLIQSLLISLIQGIQNFKSYNYVLLSIPISVFIFAVILVDIFELGVFGALISYTVGNLIGLSLTFFFLFHHIKKTDQNKSNFNLRVYIKKCLGYGWKAHLSNILTFVNYRIDLFMVNFLLNPASTGIYVIAVQITEKLWILSNAVSIVLLPRLSELEEDEEKRQAITPLVARWVLLISFFASFVLALVAPFLINTFYGKDFSLSATAVLWLLPGITVWGMARIIANDLAARGRPELNLYTSILVVFTNIVFNLLLIPKLGIVGASMATTFAYIVDSIAKVYIYSLISTKSWRDILVFTALDKQLFLKGLSILKTNCKMVIFGDKI